MLKNAPIINCLKQVKTSWVNIEYSAIPRITVLCCTNTNWKERTEMKNWKWTALEIGDMCMWMGLVTLKSYSLNLLPTSDSSYPTPPTLLPHVPTPSRHSQNPLPHPTPPPHSSAPSIIHQTPPHPTIHPRTPFNTPTLHPTSPLPILFTRGIVVWFLGTVVHL